MRLCTGPHSTPVGDCAQTELGQRRLSPGEGNRERILDGQRQKRSWVFVSCATGTGLDPLAAVDLAARSLRAERVL